MLVMAAQRRIMRAIWKNTVIAESPDTVLVEGNHYFPLSAVRREYLKDSPTRTKCPWKGEASYYHVVVSEEVNPDAAWYYPSPSEAAMSIKDHVAFWKGVEVSE
jgi:uncharacterized protein (DUF427 family)